MVKMTAFIGMISKDFAIMGTDTLCTYPRQNEDSFLKPHSYSCKTFHLPQFKSAFSVTGTLQLGLCFFNFVVESTFGIDIDSLVNISAKPLITKLQKDYEKFPEGTLYLLGFSQKSECFTGFKLLVLESEQNPEWKPLFSNTFIFTPIVLDWENKLSTKKDRDSDTELIVDLMTIQKREDDDSNFSQQVGIGGNIIVTHMKFMDNGNMIIATEVAHQRDDFLVLGEKMIT